MKYTAILLTASATKLSVPTTLTFTDGSLALIDDEIKVDTKGYPRPEQVHFLEPGTYQNIANMKGHVLNPFTKYRTTFYDKRSQGYGGQGDELLQIKPLAPWGTDGLVQPPHTKDTHHLEQWGQMRKPLIPENRDESNDLMHVGLDEYPQPDIRGPMPQNAHPDSTFSSHLHNDWTF